MCQFMFYLNEILHLLLVSHNFELIAQCLDGTMGSLGYALLLHVRLKCVNMMPVYLPESTINLYTVYPLVTLNVFLLRLKAQKIPFVAFYGVMFSRKSLVKRVSLLRFGTDLVFREE